MMSRVLTILIAGLVAAACPAHEAMAQSRRGDNPIARERGSGQPRDMGPSRRGASPMISQFRQDQAREEAREGRRISAREVVRRVSDGREGRMLNVSERGGGSTLVYVVRWEYPGGRIADITVDGRTGRILGER